MSSPLPSNMAMTTVRGRYGTWVTVPGESEPQFSPFVGMRVTFSPAYPFVTNTTALPNPLVVATAPRSFQTDAAGYMSDLAEGFDINGMGIVRNCRIVSSDDPDIWPRDWKYLVTFTGPGATNFRQFRTPAPSNATVDMAIITPQRVSTGTAASAAEIAAANAAASALAAADAVASLNKGQAGGVAPLDADGDVNDAFGVKILAGGGGSSGTPALANITGMSPLAKLLNTDTTAAAMRARIGAGTGNGTSNLVIGTTSGTAADAAVMATALAGKATDSGLVHTIGDETVGGLKIFTQPVVVGTAASADQAVRKSQLDGAVAPLTAAIGPVPGQITTLQGQTASLGTRVTTLEGGSISVVNIAALPAGVMLFASGAATARPTARTDLKVMWFTTGTPPANAIVGDPWWNEAV